MLRLAGASEGGDLVAFVARAAALDRAVLVRLRGGAGRVTAHARLPFGVPVSRTVTGSVDPPDVTVAAAGLLLLLEDAVAAGSTPSRGGSGAAGEAELPSRGRGVAAGEALSRGRGVAAGEAELSVRLPGRRDAEWRSALPPASGWTRLDEVPGEVVRSLVRAGAAALRAVPAGAAAGAGESLLDHESLTVSGAGHTVAVPLRALTAVARMGFLGDPAEPSAGSTVAVSAGPGGWIRLAAPYGSAYHRPTPALGLAPR